MSVNRRFKTLLLSAVLCASAFASFVVSAPAQAADVKSPRDSASGQATGKRQHSPALEECDDAYDEMEAMLASLTTQMDALRARCEELNTKAAEADESLAASSEESAAALAEIDEARRVFDEQVASVLDEATIAAVRQALESAGGIHVAAGDVNGDGFSVSDNTAPLLEELAALSAQLASFSESLSSSKKEFKGHVTLLK
jgi:hypothetical protein